MNDCGEQFSYHRINFIMLFCRKKKRKIAIVVFGFVLVMMWKRLIVMPSFHLRKRLHKSAYLTFWLFYSHFNFFLQSRGSLDWKKFHAGQVTSPLFISQHFSFLLIFFCAIEERRVETLFLRENWFFRCALYYAVDFQYISSFLFISTCSPGLVWSWLFLFIILVLLLLYPWIRLQPGRMAIEIADPEKLCWYSHQSKFLHMITNS